MRLSTSLIAVKRVTSPVPRSKFSDDDLEQSARLILEAEGVINPIVVRRTSLESYEVVDRHFEYYAAVRAREIEPRKGEMIGAFIVEDDKEEAITEQIKIFRKLSLNDSPSTVSSLNYEEISEIKRLVTRFGNLLQDRVETLTKKVEVLNEISTPKVLKDTLNKQLETLRNEIRKRPKEEALKLLTQIKFDLENQQEAINDLINELSKINLLTASKDDLKRALELVKGDKKAVEAAWKVIEYWKQSGRKLSWDNLKESVKPGSDNKVNGFGNETYKKLQKIGYIDN